MANRIISQELFDETLLENEEAFDLSPSEALEETIHQFLSQLGRASDDSSKTNGGGDDGRSGGPLAHLVLLHPSTEQGAELRLRRSEFRTALSLLDGCIRADGTVRFSDREEALMALRTAGDRCRDAARTPLPYLSLIRSSSSIYTFMSLLGCDDVQILRETIKVLLQLLSPKRDECSSIRTELKDSFVPAIGRVVSLTASHLNDEAVLKDLLQLGICATRSCEAAKVSYVQSALESSPPNDGDGRRGGIRVVSSSLRSADPTIVEGACNLLASLCRCDDFRDPSSASGPTGAAGASASSAHDHAVEFHRAGVDVRLIEIAKGLLLDGDADADGEKQDKLIAAVLTALRVMAVNDEVIRTMVAVGVLPLVTKALELGCERKETPSDGDKTSQNRNATNPRLATASIGLLRNLCGNDEIKTDLCLGSAARSSPSVPSSLPHLLRAMRLHPDAATLQEHACGALAAMALRRPANARAVVDAGGPRSVLAGMRRHDANTNVQRQGSLAVRNIVSRLLRERPEEGEGSKAERAAVRDVFLELGAEDVLRNMAGRHQGSVDEAYAALRDLGCEVSLVKFDAEVNENGVQRTMMFGEKHNTNFRPVFDDSEGLEGGVEEAISKFGV